jgi:murein DD-endopeptidase MepM/ murein hydrolase activator NlpD
MSHLPTQKKQAKFGRRSELRTITITKGQNSRMFTVQPVMFAGICSVVSLFMLGYLGATAYLVLRDDLIGASLARQARLQHSYEDRIAALRSRIDLITSQQLLEQQAVETRVQELVNRQNVLGSRTDVFGTALKKAAINGLTPTPVAIPKLRPSRKSASNKVIDAKSITTASNLKLGSLSNTSSPFKSSIIDLKDNRDTESSYSSSFVSFIDPDKIFAKVENSLHDVETRQIYALKNLHKNAVTKTKRIAGILRKIGISLLSNTTENIGGPLVELDVNQQFNNQITALDIALGNLKSARKLVTRLPIGSPTAGRPVSSRFGRRIDPFKRRTAMHSGMDFKAPMGFPVRATGSGKVTKAGYNGSYGRMVEIAHGNRLVTRYAHLSRIKVKLGAWVRSGKIVGKVGSTGRSTGPHLHYEIRHRGKAQNPSRYVRTGAKLKSLL